jgi:hypothetical protein
MLAGNYAKAVQTIQRPIANNTLHHYRVSLWVTRRVRVDVGLREMNRMAITLLLAFCCAGCCLLRDDSVSRELADGYAGPRELSLSIVLDRTEGALDVTLKSVANREVYEDYYRPGFKLFCVNTNGELTVLRSDCDMPGLHGIPKVKPGEEITYKLPLERFAFLTPELHVQDCIVFLEYNSRYGSTCSDALRISAPLSLGTPNDGQTYTYRAMQVRKKTNEVPEDTARKFADPQH